MIRHCDPLPFCASLSLSVCTPSLSPEGVSCLWFLLPVACIYRLQREPSPPGGIKDFCSWLRRASLLRLFFTAIFHLHPSVRLCASGFSSLPSSSLNLHGMSPQLFSSSLSPQLYGRGGREGARKEWGHIIQSVPLGNRTCASQFGVWIWASQPLYRLSYGTWPLFGHHFVALFALPFVSKLCANLAAKTPQVALPQNLTKCCFCGDFAARAL